MGPSNQIRKKIEFLLTDSTYKIFRFIKKGDLISRGNKNRYILIDKDNYHLEENTLTQSKRKSDLVYYHFSGSGTNEMLSKIDSVYELHGFSEGEKRIVPFSKLFEKNAGECLESSILTQLISQKSRESYLISRGFLKISPPFGDNHSFNVILNNDKFCLIDILNPLQIIKDKLKHYVKPIVDIDLQNGREVIIESNHQKDRFYFL